MIDIDEEQLLEILTGRSTRPVVVGYLNTEQRHAIGALSPVIWLSKYTLFKLEAHQRGRDFEIYRLLPTIIEHGEARKANDRQLLFLWSSKNRLNRPFKACVKVTRDRRETFLDSVYRIKRSQIQTTVARTTPVRLYPDGKWFTNLYGNG
ncbi:MAG TPA: hypothetical protein VG328_15335 [Stellaceae bacterium]|jgi:hypothetical protein|nr:hypothetical protein [Stellaceae bacterium]